MLIANSDVFSAAPAAATYGKTRIYILPEVAVAPIEFEQGHWQATFQTTTPVAA